MHAVKKDMELLEFIYSGRTNIMSLRIKYYNEGYRYRESTISWKVWRLLEMKFVKEFHGCYELTTDGEEKLCDYGIDIPFGDQGD